MLIEVFCGDGKCGLGHLRRSSALAETLRARGYDVRLTENSLRGRQIFSAASPGSPDAALWVFDLADDVSPLVEEAEDRGIPCLALDYFGDAQPSLTISVMERENTVPSGRRFSGLEYAIVRQEILEAIPSTHETGVLVLLGGGDLKGEGLQVAESLTAAAANVTLIAGPLRREKYSLAGTSIRVMEDPPNLPSLMAGCDWGVVSGGVTMSEMLYLGKAVFVVPQTAEERGLANHVMELGGLMGVGLDAVRIPDAQLKAAASAASRRIVDGRGVARIIDALEDLL